MANSKTNKYEYDSIPEIEQQEGVPPQQMNDVEEARASSSSTSTSDWARASDYDSSPVSRNNKRAVLLTATAGLCMVVLLVASDGAASLQQAQSVGFQNSEKRLKMPWLLAYAPKPVPKAGQEEGQDEEEAAAATAEKKEGAGLEHYEKHVSSPWLMAYAPKPHPKTNAEEKGKAAVQGAMENAKKNTVRKPWLTAHAPRTQPKNNEDAANEDDDDDDLVVDLKSNTTGVTETDASSTDEVSANTDENVSAATGASHYQITLFSTALMMAIAAMMW